MELDWMNDPEEAEVLANEYPDGFFAGSYRVKETVELNGVRIPSLIEVRRVLPSKPGSAGPHSEWVWTVTVDSFGSEELDSYQPEIPEGYRIAVYDSRLRDIALRIPSMSYTVEDGVWPVSPPPDVVARFESEKLRRAEVPGGSPVQPTVLIIFLVIFIGAPGIVFFLMKKRGHDV